MSFFVFAVVAATFVLAGFVKGVIGLGLPTVAMGLLAIVMTPAPHNATHITSGIPTDRLLSRRSRR